MGTALSDTVLAGPGAIRPTVARGHFGRGAARTIYGQRVRVDQIGAQATRAFGPDAREVVMVPWDYDAGCAPVAWNGSARWMAPERSGLFRAQIRPREHWVEGLPTFDLMGIAYQPYGGQLRRGEVSSQAGENSATRLTPEELLRFLDDVPPYRRSPDSLGTLILLRRFAADPAMAKRYPVDEVISSLRDEFQDARRRAIQPPISGTFRFELTRPGDTTQVLFVRLDDAATTVDFGGAADTALIPALPTGYAVYGSASTSLDGFAASCHVFPGDGLGYIELNWHGPPAPDGSARYTGDFAERFIEVLLPHDSVAAWRARKSAAWMHEADPARAPGGPVGPFVFVPNRPLTFIKKPGRPMRVEGEITYPYLRTYRVRGEWISDEALECSH